MCFVCLLVRQVGAQSHFHVKLEALECIFSAITWTKRSLQRKRLVPCFPLSCLLYNLFQKWLQNAWIWPMFGILLHFCRREFKFFYSHSKFIFIPCHLFLQSAELMDAFWRSSLPFSEYWEIESFLLHNRHITKATVLLASAVSLGSDLANIWSMPLPFPTSFDSHRHAEW